MLVEFIRSLVNNSFVNVILTASHATFILQSKVVLVTLTKLKLKLRADDFQSKSITVLVLKMGDQENKSGGSVSLTPQVEDVMKRICSNSKVGN